MKKYRPLCDQECSGTCDKTCLYFCHHPVAARICKSPDPIGFLYNVSGVSTPQARRARQNKLCHRETTNYNRIPTRIY
uniref:Uncharacterized protein n=1 Tax=Panagrolaimus sp. JU765 TaxID=591449 RepID=A0AC34QTB3_9BILA